MVAHIYKYVQNHLIIYSEWVICMICEFYLNKAILKKVFKYISDQEVIPVNLSKNEKKDFPGGTVASTLRSQYRGSGFDSWSGNWILHVPTMTQCSQANIYFLHGKNSLPGLE